MENVSKVAGETDGKTPRKPRNKEQEPLDDARKTGFYFPVSGR
jgi:hypothetical protein